MEKTRPSNLLFNVHIDFSFQPKISPQKSASVNKEIIFHVIKSIELKIYIEFIIFSC